MLTLWAPDARYKILRRYADCFPCDRLWWCSLQSCTTDDDIAFGHQSFIPRRLHWRLQGTALGSLFTHELQARAIARKIADMAKDLHLETIWCLPELGAAGVAYHLQQMLQIPLHATSHDAHETARHIVSPLYYPFYARSVRRVFERAASVDAISQGMLTHLQLRHSNLRESNSMVFHPSIASDQVSEAASEPEWAGRESVRRIGLCGSMRVSKAQWRTFIKTLSRLPFEIEIVAFAYEELFHESELPANVTLSMQAYAETERDVVNAFRQAGVDACYLGLWQEPHRRLFARTSLSAKLTTYAASGLPVIVDGPEDSAAWQLIDKYGAGVLCAEDEDAAFVRLKALFTDAVAWQGMARGATDLCGEQFSMENNMHRFRELLCRTAEHPSSSGYDVAG